MKLHIFWRNKLASQLNFTPFHRYFSRLHQIQQQLKHIINNRHNKTNPKQRKHFKGDRNKKITQYKERLKSMRPRVQDLSLNMTQINAPLHTQSVLTSAERVQKRQSYQGAEKARSLQTNIKSQQMKPRIKPMQRF